jgi:hypothetical protein
MQSNLCTARDRADAPLCSSANFFLDMDHVVVFNTFGGLLYSIYMKVV